MQRVDDGYHRSRGFMRGLTPVQVLYDELQLTQEQWLEQARKLKDAEAQLAELNRRTQVEREHLWFSKLDLIVDGVVEAVPYEDFAEVKKGDLVIICRGEYRGHCGVVEARHHANSSGSYVKLSRVWPVTWRGPAGQYWPAEHVFGAFDKLQPKVPDFASVAEAEWWMHDARDVQVGQEVAFSIPVYSTDMPWLERHTEYHYEGTLVSIEEFDIVHWYRHRPSAKGKFQVLAFDREMEPTLTWVNELVRL